MNIATKIIFFIVFIYLLYVDTLSIITIPNGENIADEHHDDLHSIQCCYNKWMNEQNIWPIDHWRIIVEYFSIPDLYILNDSARETWYNRNCFRITNKVLMLLWIADEKTTNIENIINSIGLMRCFCSKPLKSWKF